jgi:acyl-CoA thioesterase
MLADVKSLLSARSNLRRKVLDVLHNGGIEIMSASFMNQRKMPDDSKVIPVTREPAATDMPESRAESVVFDKAEEAAQRDNARESLEMKIAVAEKNITEATGEKKTQLQDDLKMYKEQLKQLETVTNVAGST